jgi:hypothetical protein
LTSVSLKTSDFKALRGTHAHTAVLAKAKDTSSSLVVIVDREYKGLRISVFSDRDLTIPFRKRGIRGKRPEHRAELREKGIGVKLRKQTQTQSNMIDVNVPHAFNVEFSMYNEHYLSAGF